jgi:hypothetical protein
VWQSQNAAASSPASVQFVPLTDHLAALSGVLEPAISVGAVSVQPGGTGVVLAGLGDPNDALDSYYGAGLLRSTNGGKTWSLITQTMDLEDGLSTQDYSFVGEGFAGFAWNSTNVQVVVAAVSQAYEGTLVGADQAGKSYEGLYYSQDGGATWHLAEITDGGGQDVQGPGDVFSTPDGNAATAVVWNPVRQVFVAAVRYHGFYQSSDGVTWTRMAVQPGPGFTALNCPTEAGGLGVAGCPIFRGSLAVNPLTGDTFAWSVDVNNQDQGIWQDQCAISGSGAGASCTNQSITFGVQLSTAPLESSTDGGDATIANGDYNLTLAAVPSQQDTLLFAGANDLWKCSLANSCAWRNTTNTTTCMSAAVGEYQHAVAWDTGNTALMLVGNDSGLWRSTDDVGETGQVCSTTDATHFQNLNGSLGSLAEVESLAQSGSSAGTLLAGLGANGTAGIVNAPATAGDWNQVLSGEGGVVAIDSLNTGNSWFVNAEAGVAIYHCSATGLCTPGGFGTAPVVGEAQVEGDGLAMGVPASFLPDAVNANNLLIGTCRVWDGPASGAGWTAANAISPALDGTGGQACEGNALIGTLTALEVTGGGEQVYAGMTGAQDGGGVVPGHVFGGTVPAGGGAGTWTDLALSPVTNGTQAFNAYGMEVSGLFVDPHDGTGGTVYAAIAGFSSASAPVQQVYRSTDAGAHWTAITSNLPNSPANAVVVDPQDANTVYVAMDVGVYVTRAVGTCGAAGGTVACWAAYGTGLPEAPVTQLTAISVTGSQVLTAGTCGRGVWQIPLATSGVTTTTATATPSSLTFASQTVGTTSAIQTVTLKNTGTAAMTVTGVVLSGAAAGDYAETDTCVGQTVAKGASCVVKVSFSPSAAGPRNATMAIEANIAGGEILVPLSGTGLTTGSVTLLPASLTFGNVQVGTSSATQAVSVQNQGQSSVTISGVVVTGAFAKVTNTCGSSLAAQTSCAVTVSFAPLGAGPATGSLTVTDSSGTQSAALSGTGVTGPTDTLSTLALAFPGTVIGQNSILAVTITNSGGLPLTGIGTSVSGTNGADFVAVSGCGGTLAGGANCNITVTFVPSVAGTETAALTISDALKSQKVTLTGVGKKPPLIEVSPSAMAFGNEQINMTSVAKTLTLTNGGGSPLANPSFSIGGPGATNFAVGATTCTASLLPQTNCTVLVTFTPLTTGATTATVALTATGTPLFVLQAVPAQLNFPATADGVLSAGLTVTLSNLGKLGVNGLTLSLTGPYQLSATQTTCGVKLGPLSFCTVGVVFAPTASGSQPGTLTISVSNLGVSPVTVPLNGTGVAEGAITINPTQMTFGSVVVGTASAAQTLTVTNGGQATLLALALATTGDYSLMGNGCSGALPAGMSCTAGVVLTPGTTGTRLGTLTVSTTSPGVTPVVAPLTGTGILAGSLSATPAVVTFGALTVGGTSAPQTVTLSNAGATTLNGVQYLLAGDYGLPQNTCGAQIASGATCTFTVNFSPSQPGTRIGSVTVKSTNAGFTPLVVGLTGTGLAAASLVVTPASLSFGQVAAGTNSVAQQLTVQNPGTGALAGLRIATSAPFSVGSGSCGTTLAAGAGCSAPVTFTPVTGGSQSGVVTVSSSSLGVAAVMVPVSGTGVLPGALSVTPAAVSFPATTVGTASSAMSVMVANSGGLAVAGLAIGISGDFKSTASSCTATLAGGASCTVLVAFEPTLSGGRQGFLTATSTTAGVASASSALSGTGLTPAALTVTPSTLNFAPVLIDQTGMTQTVTVANGGQSGISNLALTVSQGFALDPTRTTCTAVLAAGANCVAGVQFAPLAEGAITGQLTASAAGAATPATAALNGTGALPPGISVAPGAVVTFGTTGIGQAGVPVVVTVTNSGTISALTGLNLAVDATGSSDGFGLSANTCATLGASGLAAGASCTANVTFVPPVAGRLTGNLLLTSTNGANGAHLELGGIGFDFKLSVLGTATATVIPGQTGYVTLAVTPLGGTSGVFQFQCGGLPANSLCLFNPSQQPPLPANVTGDVVMAITTGAPTTEGALRPGPPRPGTPNGGFPKSGLLLACGVLAVPLFWVRRRRASLLKTWLLGAVLLAGCVGAVTSCAGSHGSGGQLHYGGGTPPGSYTIPVTAISAGVKHSYTVTLVVN